jgi:drug/metabolite transporter (DMT)-like permease
LVAAHGSGFIGMMVSFVPLTTIVVSVPMLGVYPTPRQLAGVVGGLLCMSVLFADSMSRNMPAADFWLALSVPLTYALTNTFIKQRLAEVPSLALAAAIQATTAYLLLPLMLLPSEQLRWNDELAAAVLSLFTLGVFGTGIALFLFTKLIQDQGPLFAGMVTYVVPVGAILWGWVDEEVVSPRQLVALAGIFAMVALVQYRSVPAPLARRPG